jgi:F-type H+-transporting ATPase subunit gamma
MANLKDIRNRINSVRSIQQVTKAMKMVAVAKMRRAQQRMEQARPYANRLQDVILSLLPDVDRAMLPLLNVREIKRAAFVIISSDRGLAGSFNTNIIKTAESEIKNYEGDQVDLFCIGKKGCDYFRRRDYNIIEEHTGFWNELDLEHSIKIGNGVISHFTNGFVDRIHVIYNDFKNMAVQEIRSRILLPIEYEEGSRKSFDRIYEPSKEELVRSLIPLHLNIFIWRVLLESYASEQAARMVAMENATENAGEMITELNLKYNNARQAAITKEILEIVSGAEALVQ